MHCTALVTLYDADDQTALKRQFQRVGRRVERDVKSRSSWTLCKADASTPNQGSGDSPESSAGPRVERLA